MSDQTKNTCDHELTRPVELSEDYEVPAEVIEQMGLLAQQLGDLAKEHRVPLVIGACVRNTAHPENTGLQDYKIRSTCVLSNRERTPPAFCIAYAYLQGGLLEGANQQESYNKMAQYDMLWLPSDATDEQVEGAFKAGAAKLAERQKDLVEHLDIDGLIDLLGGELRA